MRSIATRKSSQHRVIVAAITVLYLVYVVQSSVQWFVMRRGLVDNGETRETIFISSTSLNTGWFVLITNICALFQSMLSDGLIVSHLYSFSISLSNWTQDMALFQRLESLLSRHLLVMFSAPGGDR